MPVRVFSVDGAPAPLVAGLTWRAVPSPATKANQARVLRDGSAYRPALVWAQADTAAIGFLPRAELPLTRLPRRLLPASALFASLPRLGRGTSLLALELPRSDDADRQMALIAVRDGLPMPTYDQVVPYAEATDRARSLLLQLQQQVPDSPRLYGISIGGIVSEKISWADIVAEGRAAPMRTPSSSLTRWLVLGLVVAVAMGGKLGWDEWQKLQHRRMADASKRVDPNVAYAQSMQAALATEAWIGPAELEQIVRGVARLPIELGGFVLDGAKGIACEPTRNECTASYRKPADSLATYTNLAAALPSWIDTVAYGNDGRSATVKLRPLDATPRGRGSTVDELIAEGDVQFRFWPRVQPLETLPASFSLALPKSITGVLPPGAREGEIRQLVRPWQVSATLPAFALDQMPSLPGLTWSDTVVLRTAGGDGKASPTVTLTLTGRLHALRSSP